MSLGLGQKKPRLERDWTHAIEKRDNELGCRNCGGVLSIEAAHALGREHDFNPPVRPYIAEMDLGLPPEKWAHPRRPTVHPDRIIPLCGPSTSSNTCHGLDHAGKLDKLRLLTLDEQIQAVADAGGIEQARSALIPRSQRERTVHLIARCPEHGLHGDRIDCFVCQGPVEQVAMQEVAR